MCVCACVFCMEVYIGIFIYLFIYVFAHVYILIDMPLDVFNVLSVIEFCCCIGGSNCCLNQWCCVVYCLKILVACRIDWHCLIFPSILERQKNFINDYEFEKRNLPWFLSTSGAIDGSVSFMLWSPNHLQVCL